MRIILTLLATSVFAVGCAAPGGRAPVASEALAQENERHQGHQEERQAEDDSAGHAAELPRTLRERTPPVPRAGRLRLPVLR